MIVVSVRPLIRCSQTDQYMRLEPFTAVPTKMVVCGGAMLCSLEDFSQVEKAADSFKTFVMSYHVT